MAGAEHANAPEQSNVDDKRNSEVVEDEDEQEHDEASETDASEAESESGEGSGARKKKKKKKKKRRAGDASSSQNTSPQVDAASKKEAEKRYSAAVDLLSGNSEDSMWIKLDGANILDSRIGKLCQALRGNTQVLSLDLAGNHITCNGAVALAACLREGAAPDLIELNLQDNPLEEEGEAALAELQQVRRNLKVLLGPSQPPCCPPAAAPIKGGGGGGGAAGGGSGSMAESVKNSAFLLITACVPSPVLVCAPVCGPAGASIPLHLTATSTASRSRSASGRDVGPWGDTRPPHERSYSRTTPVVSGRSLWLEEQAQSADLCWQAFSDSRWQAAPPGRCSPPCASFFSAAPSSPLSSRPVNLLPPSCPERPPMRLPPRTCLFSHAATSLGMAVHPERTLPTPRPSPTMSRPAVRAVQPAVGTHRAAAAELLSQLLRSECSCVLRAVSATGLLPRCAALALQHSNCNALHCAVLRCLRHMLSHVGGELGTWRDVLELEPHAPGGEKEAAPAPTRLADAVASVATPCLGQSIGTRSPQVGFALAASDLLHSIVAAGAACSAAAAGSMAASAGPGRGEEPAGQNPAEPPDEPALRAAPAEAPAPSSDHEAGSGAAASEAWRRDLGALLAGCRVWREFCAAEGPLPRLLLSSLPMAQHGPAGLCAALAARYSPPPPYVLLCRATWGGPGRGGSRSWARTMQRETTSFRGRSC